VNGILGSSVALAIIHTGRRPTTLLGLVLVRVRSALQLRELESAVAALEERAVDVDMRLFFFFRFRAGIVRTALTAAVRNVAAFALVLLFYEVLALHYEKAKTAVEAKLADHGRMIHGFLDWFDNFFFWPFILSIFL